MARRRIGKKRLQLLGYGLLGIIAVIIAIGQFLLEHIWIIAIIVFIPLATFVTVRLIKYSKKQNNQLKHNRTSSVQRTSELEKEAEEDNIFSNFSTEALACLKRAQDAELANDYLGARVGYMSCVELLKRDKTAIMQLEFAKKEYKDFVQRDPIFKRLIEIFMAGVRENPGILQSDITKKAEDMDWGELRSYNRPIAKDDIRYALYFADQFGLVIRKKEGRSYRLYLPEQLKDVTKGKER
jgi:hypothetical protein